MPGGISISGSASGVETKMIGTLVKVSSIGLGKIAVSSLSGGVSGTVDLSGRTVGSYDLAPGAALYEWAGSGYVTEISLSDLSWTDIVSASSVSYAHLNSAGQVDLLLLNDVTGNCYTYGLASTGKTSTGSFSVSLSTVEVENSKGSTGTLTGGSGVRSGTFIGVAATATGTVVNTVSLASKHVSREDFDGTEYVRINGVAWRISGDVQVYNAASETWFSDSDSLGSALEQALAYSDEITVYYDRTAATGGMVRVIVVA